MIKLTNLAPHKEKDKSKKYYLQAEVIDSLS